MSGTTEEELKQTISILKKVEKWEKSNEYTRFLFIISIIGIIAIFEGFLAYITVNYVNVDITSIYIGAKLDDPILTFGFWLIQLSLISSLVIYSQTGKGILDTWTPYIRKLGLLWGLMYIISFAINVGLIFVNLNSLGPTNWSINIGIAIFISVIILKPLEDTKNLRTGLMIIGIITWLLGIVLIYIPSEYAMFTLGMTIGFLLLLLATVNYWKV
ncbi:MAG: hypothetical protein HeimC3_49310 [Candidatus Heimdallarchaeota archaeon LC_3]|nr:MAG: hypothetical protein HeimC3_49310 [Candidatus Heimdallarchaeota archaeon LC_3]